MVKTRKYLTGILPVIVSIAIAVLFLSQPLAQAQQGAAPMTTQTTTGQVTPVLNTNVTWSLFNSSMSPNEYLNGSGDPQYLNAEPSVYNPNYITVIPADISSPQLTGNDQLGWKNSANWTVQNPPNGGGVSTITNSTSGIQMTSNESNSATSSPEYKLTIPDSALPSQNPAYDFITIIANSSMPTGSTIAINPTNATRQYNQNMPITSNTTGTTTATSIFYSINLATFAQETSIQFNTTVGKGYTPDILITIHQNLPEGSASITTTLKALTITTYPIYLGTNATGQQVNIATGPAHLTNFKMPMPVTVSNNGYTESLSQPLGMAQNLTETQAAISSGQYVEEVTQQAIMSFPTAPDLTYGPSNMTLEMNGINASQVTLINVNGVSYSSGLSGFNGTSFNIGSENPNSPNSVIIQIEYTAAQWNSFTSAPSFFSVAGIEYYWWIFIISTLGAVGLFAGLKNYANGKANNFREVPPPRTR